MVTVLGRIEGIVSCLGTAIVELTFPLNALKGWQVTMRTRHKVVLQDNIDLNRLLACIGLSSVECTTTAQRHNTFRLRYHIHPA